MKFPKIRIPDSLKAVLFGWLLDYLFKKDKPKRKPRRKPDIEPHAPEQ